MRDLIQLCHMWGISYHAILSFVIPLVSFLGLKMSGLASEMITLKYENKEKSDIKEVEQIFYKGIKIDDKHGLLLGHLDDTTPAIGNDTNYVIAGTTGAGKTKKMQALLLNWLCNKQGTVYIGDLKGTDFKRFMNCKYVNKYIDDIENIEELIKAFKEEYEYRVDLFSKGNYVDLDDYNSKNTPKLREFLLIIDEYADISDEYTKGGKPIGVYKDIVKLARKCRAFGGRIVLGTQRPSADVICGTLKVNCSIVGMKASKVNSKIMIDSEGCESIKKREALTIIDGEIVKIYSYYLTNKMIEELTEKLK